MPTPSMEPPAGLTCPLCGRNKTNVVIAMMGFFLGGTNKPYIQVEVCGECRTRRGDERAFHDVLRAADSN